MRALLTAPVQITLIGDEDLSPNENYQRRVNIPIFGPITLRNLSFAASLGFGVLGMVLTTVSIFVTLSEPETRVTFEIISATDVLDLRRSLEDLRIEFRGQDIQEQGLNLRVMKIHVENSGETHIRTVDFSNIEWGIRIVGGQVIEAKVDLTNAANLITTDDLRYVGSDTIGFPKIVLDKGDAFAIELLVLHPNHLEPVVRPIGKIAGVKNFDLVPAPLPGQEVGFVGQALGGNLNVVAVRSAVYFVGYITILFASIFALLGIAVLVDHFKEGRRRKRVLQTDTIKTIEMVRVKDGLVELFASHGIVGLKLVYELVQHPHWFVWSDSLNRWIDIPRRNDIEFPSSVYQELETQNYLVLRGVCNALWGMDVFQRGDDDRPVIDPGFVGAVEELLIELGDPGLTG